MIQKKLSYLLVPAVAVLAIDQFTKWLVRVTPELHNYTIIDGWLQLYYTKNPGMALGIDILSTPVISSIAIIAAVGILVYVLRNIEQTSTGYLICMGLIVGGALGNISDRIFMGLIEGDGGVLHGHVVDFIYFSLQIKDWSVFPYIFNFADVAISTSIIALVVFNKKLLAHEFENKDEGQETETAHNTGDTPEQKEHS